MIEVTDKLLRALTRPHIKVSRVTITDSSGSTLVPDLRVEGGNVQVERNSSIRRRTNIRLYDHERKYAPTEWNDLLHPLSGNELKLYRGVRFEDGDEELVPLGVFDPYATDISESGDNVNIGVDAYDRARKVERARLHRPYHVPIATNYGTAIRDLIEHQVPGLSFGFVSVDFLTPVLRFGASGEEQGGGDPWRYAQEMAESIGYELFFDVYGVCRLAPRPDPRNAPVDWYYLEGEEAVFMSVQRRITKEETYNRVIVSGNNSSIEEGEDPIRGEAWDDNPDSPTYVGGPFGDIPTFLQSEFVVTPEQAGELAQARLNQVLGVQETVNLTALTNPAHDVGDIIHIAARRAGISTAYLIDRLNINLSASQSMNITVRERRTRSVA